MATNPPKRRIPRPEESVIEWMLDSDASIRWQVMRDLTDAPAEKVAAERAKVATEGWGARLLARKEANGRWGGEPDNPEWTCLLSLLWLRDLGLDPSSTEARRAVALIRDNVTWHWWDNKPFFEGEVEPCINGRVVSVGSYFRQGVGGLVDRLLGEQMDDGGWNCEQEHGSTRGSFHTTINVLEGLAEHERATGGSSAVIAACKRGRTITRTDIQLSTEIISIKWRGNEYQLVDSQGNDWRFDEVVFATNAYEGSRILRDLDGAEPIRAQLDKIEYFKTSIAIHGDEQLMPADKKFGRL